MLILSAEDTFHFVTYHFPLEDKKESPLTEAFFVESENEFIGRRP